MYNVQPIHSSVFVNFISTDFEIFLLRYSHKMVCLNYFLPEISVFKIISN